MLQRVLGLLTNPEGVALGVAAMLDCGLQAWLRCPPCLTYDVIGGLGRYKAGHGTAGEALPHLLCLPSPLDHACKRGAAIF